MNENHGVNLELVERAQAGDNSAREALVDALADLVRAVARRFAGGILREDLVQAGYVGVFEALGRFDPSRGVQFSTYALPFIMGAVRQCARAEQDEIWGRRRAAAAAMASRWLARSAQAIADGPKTLGVLELAGQLGLDPGELVGYLDATVPGDASLTDSWLDRLAVRQAVLALPARHRFVIVSRFFREMSQQEVAGYLGVSQAHVSRLEHEALAFLQRLLHMA